MAAPSYTEDLTDVDLAETTTGWNQVNFAGGGGGSLSASPDLATQGINCVDRQISSNDRGAAFNNGATSAAVASGVHIFQWMFNGTPGLVDTIQNTGVCVIAGTGTGAMVQFHVDGSDTYGAAGRTGKCYAYRYVNTSNTSPPYRTLTGSPGATPSYFGASINTTASVKGANLGVDAIRYGTGAYLTAGELVSAGDASDDPCTFDGFATENDKNQTGAYNRWGILTKVNQSYELQGRFAIGQNNSKVATLARFKDSDVGVVFLDTIHSETDFTQVIIDHASTRVEWTNINFTALGTHNPGRVVVNNASSTVIIVGGVWSGIGITTLRAGCDITGLTWRNTDQITLNSATLDGCTIDKNTATSAIVTTPSNMTNNVVDNEFISDGTGHAINLGSVAASTSFTWKNTLSGYVAGTTGDPVTTGTSGNEAILCNVAASQKLTINVATGYTVPSVKNDGTGTVAVVSAGVTIDVNVKDQAGANVQSALVYIDDDLGVVGNITNTTTDASGNITQATYNGAETTATLRVRKYGYKPFISTITLLSNTATNVTLITDPQQT
jgi:hypothetical protein